MKADVVIVGAGAAGIAAALEAASRGAHVAVLDPAAEPGGTARGSGGGTFIAGSPLQERLGIQDSPARALEDWLAWGGETVDVEWARRYVEAGVPDLYGWLAALGVEWVQVKWDEGNGVPRWHAPRDGGLGVIRALERAARGDPRIVWAFRTRMTDLVATGGRVVGALAEGPEGPVEYRAGAVLMASGGFTNNLEMVRRHAAHLPPETRILLGGGEGARGDGHAILARAGAQFVNMDAIWMYPYATPDYQDPAGLRGLVCRGLEGDVWVNRQGHRFHNEDLRGGATGAVALLRQRPATCWSIIDARIAARYTVGHPRYRHGTTPLRDRLQQLLDESPFIDRGDTLEALAAAAGLDGGALREIITAHNRMIATGMERDPDFGRSLRGLDPLTEPPFYAIQFFPLARKNLGGVRTNLSCQVLDRRDRAVPGLFAAGEMAGMAGGRINGRAALEGTMFGPSLFSGRVAGRCMI